MRALQNTNRSELANYEGAWHLLHFFHLNNPFFKAILNSALVWSIGRQEGKRAMFNIGLGEIVVILLVALLVVGPEDLPKVARGIAKAIKYIKNSVQEVVKTLNLEEEITEIKEMNDLVKETLQEANPVHMLEKELGEVKQNIDEAVGQVNPAADLAKEINDIKGLTKETLRSANPLPELKKELSK